MIEYNINIDYNFNQLLDNLSKYNVPDEIINLIKDNINNIIKEYKKEINKYRLKHKFWKETNDDIKNKFGEIQSIYYSLEELYDNMLKEYKENGLE